MKVHYMVSIHISKGEKGYGSACGLEFADFEKEVFITEYLDKVKCENCKKTELFKIHSGYYDMR